ncbi:MAG: hypothetical protein Kow0010_22870 [Dehalococcoidia bacterium]
MDPFRLSHSKIQAFFLCRKQYWFRYLSREPRPPAVPSAPGIVGTAVHRAMKALCETDDSAAAARELDTYLRMPAHEVAGPGTEPYNEAFDLLLAGCDAHQTLMEHSQDRYAELSATVLWRHGGVSLRARIDRADRIDDGRWVIVDWKTGSFDDDDTTDQQLDIGHLALRTQRRLARHETVRAIAWNLRTGHQRIRELTRDDAAGMLDSLSALARRMQEVTEFPAMPNPLCRYCEWLPGCPEGQDAVG